MAVPLVCCETHSYVIIHVQEEAATHELLDFEPDAASHTNNNVLDKGQGCFSCFALVIAHIDHRLKESKILTS